MIALVRHPPVHVGGRCYGRLDLPVADPADVADLAHRITILTGRGEPPPQWTVWTSPARRCRLVAEALGAHRVDERLQELDFGAWEGMAWDDVSRASLDVWAADPLAFAAPNGETGAILVARVRAFAAGCTHGNHVVITHGGPLKVLGPILRNGAISLLAPPPPPGSINIVG